MSLDHLASAALILAALVVVAAAGGALYYLGVVAWAVGLFGKVVKWSVAAGFATWQATLSWADWRTAGALIAVLLTLGYVSHASGAPLVAVPVAALLLTIGLVACLAFMYLSFERYEVARGYKAVHNPIKGQELAVDVARYGDRVGVMLLIVAAVGTVMGFAQLNHALYVSFGHGWYRFESADEDATFLDFLAYTLVHLLRVVDVLDLAGTYTEVRVNVLRPGKWPATTLLLGFKSFFTLLLLQQVFAGVREGKLLSETVTDFWSPHAPIHDRARFALPQFGPSSVGAIIRSLRALGPITKEQRDRLPDVFAAMGPSVIPELIRHAADDHELTRAVVAKALGLLHTPDAVEPLIVLTADPSEPVRAAAVAGLGEIAAGLGHRKDRPAAVPCRGKWRVARVLRKLKIKIPLPADSAPVERLRPAELLPACLAAVRGAVTDPSPLVRAEAVAALGRIGAPAAAAADDLTSVLKADGDEVRKRAAAALGLIAADAELVVPSLAAALGHPNPEVRAAAAAALGGYGEAAADAVPMLVLLLQDRDDAVRAAAAASVKRIGVVCEESTRLLVEGLTHADNVVRAQTAEALGVIGDTAGAAAPVLVEALKDSNDAVRAKAAAALGKMGDGVAELAVPALTRLLRDEDNWVRALAAEALGQMGEAAEDAAPALLRSLRHANPLVRANAAEALGKLGAEDSRPALEAAGRDDDARVRAKAVRALGGLGPAPSTIDLVTSLLTDADPEVRATAIEVVGGWPEVTVAADTFHGLITDANDEVAVRAIRLAPQLSTVDAVLPTLRERLKEIANPLIQVAAAAALGRLGPPAAEAAPELTTAAREGDADLRLAAMRALALIQPPDAAGVFAAGLRDPDPQVRKVVSGGLMKVTAIPDDAVPAVVESLHDPDAQVRANAAHLLSLLDPVPTEAVPGLIDAATAPGDGLRLNAATALRRVATPDAQEALRALLADPNAKVRLVAAGSLATTFPDDPQVRAALRDALADPNPKVQSGVEELVRSLGIDLSEPAPEEAVAAG